MNDNLDAGRTVSYIGETVARKLGRGPRTRARSPALMILSCKMHIRAYSNANGLECAYFCLFRRHFGRGDSDGCGGGRKGQLRPLPTVFVIHGRLLPRRFRFACPRSFRLLLSSQNASRAPFVCGFHPKCCAWIYLHARVRSSCHKVEN